MHRWRQPTRPVITGRRAQIYGRLSRLGLGWLYRTVARQVLANVPAGGAVLDVGTGPGRLLVEMAALRPDVQYVGIDPSRDMVRAARQHATLAQVDRRVDVVVAGAEALPFSAERFDAVVSTLSSHHWADAARAVAEQARVIRPGGRLWVIDLRLVQPATVPASVLEQFPPTHVARPRLGGMAAVAFGCYKATKARADDAMQVSRGR